MPASVDQLVDILRCPEDRSRVALAEPPLVERLNAAIDAKQLQNRAGKPVEKRLDGALVRADGKVAYPIVDQIPVLIIDEGIWLENQPSESAAD